MAQPKEHQEYRMQYIASGEFKGATGWAHPLLPAQKDLPTDDAQWQFKSDDMRQCVCRRYELEHLNDEPPRTVKE
jgi:hypothetical protein